MELLELSDKGLFCKLGDFYIDPWGKVENAVITHAHGDHARYGMQNYITVAECEHILRKRITDAAVTTYSYGEVFKMGEVEVSFHPAGHILGSSQVRIEYQGEVWVFTGDFKRDRDLTCRPFEVVQCDVFISEATFSLPIYRWPDFQNEMKEVHDWWMKNREEGFNSVLCCYALGKAQRLIAGIRELTDDPIWVHGTIDELNQCYEKTGMSWPHVHKVALDSKEKFKGVLILCPPSALGSSWGKRLSPKKVAFASGWMRLRGNRRRKGYERGFVVSDHADWPSLIRTVKETNCKKVYFTHGHTDAIVRYLREEGIKAYDLKLPYDTDGES
ncbi:MAG TPA: ligase-associated DNA damage response exonuclease [Bacteriovoracaceae bacterium]|nr:ligase-associated DNA damage response exonuclease [Bacteriovoracaceae bacterium]